MLFGPYTLYGLYALKPFMAVANMTSHSVWPGLDLLTHGLVPSVHLVQDQTGRCGLILGKGTNGVPTPEAVTGFNACHFGAA